MARPTIFLVRHGETEWNRSNRYQGWLDSPLTAKGNTQAHAVGRVLGTITEAMSAELVSSPIGRARHTAEIIHAYCRGPAPLRFDDRLREISLGCWEGLDRGEISTRRPGIFDGDGHYKWYFHTPDGETYEAFSARITDWLWSNDDKPIIVVAHGVVNRVLRGIYAGLSRSAALRLPVPQNRIFRLSGSAIEELDVQATEPG
jgi:probable phosphoglycerate mutase